PNTPFSVPWSQTTTPTTMAAARAARTRKRQGNDDFQGAGGDAPAGHRGSEATASRISDAGAPAPRALRRPGGGEDPARARHRLQSPHAGAGGLLPRAARGEARGRRRSQADPLLL